MVAGSVRIRKRAVCRLPPLGAFEAAARMSSRSSVGIGSGRRRRIERWVKIASPSGMESLVWSTARILHRSPLPRANDDAPTESGEGLVQEFALLRGVVQPRSD